MCCQRNAGYVNQPHPSTLHVRFYFRPTHFVIGDDLIIHQDNRFIKRSDMLIRREDMIFSQYVFFPGKINILFL